MHCYTGHFKSNDNLFSVHLMVVHLLKIYLHELTLKFPPNLKNWIKELSAL